MSYIDVGKDAKHMGRTKPSVARKLDPVPERPTPAKSDRKIPKPYGYSYESRFWWTTESSWSRQYCWFATKRARDQSMAAMRRNLTRWDWYRDLRAEPSPVTVSVPREGEGQG